MLNSEAIKIMKASEGCVLHPYVNKNDKPSIGWGNTFYENGQRVKMTDKAITQERADDLFQNISTAFLKDVTKSVKVVLNEFQLGALTSLAYNIGIDTFKASTLLSLINASAPIASIESHFMEFNHFDHKVSNGLTARRAKEVTLFKKKILNLNIMQKIKDYFTAHKTPILVVGGGLVLVFLYKKFVKK